MKISPVLFIIFNRPNPTSRVFEAIRAARPEKLYIAADAPRVDHPDDITKCADARKITEIIDWPCEVKRLYQNNNLGCGIGVRTALDWFFHNEQEGIILEDDCVPDLSFFEFARQMLERYRNDKRIISINGSNLGYKPERNDSYFFSRFMNMWGWATWADRAKEIDYEMGSWKVVKNKKLKLYRILKQGTFDFDLKWVDYWKERFNLVTGNAEFTWDYQWVWYQIRKEKLAIVPSVNMITNIGFHDEATHTKSSENPSSNILSGSIPFPLVHPENLKPDLIYEENFVKWVWCYHKRIPLKNYLMNRVYDLLKK